MLGSIVLLSFERYRATVHPFKEKFNNRKLGLASLVIALFIITFWVIEFNVVEKLSMESLVLEFFGYLVTNLYAPLMSMCYFNHRISKVIQSLSLIHI